MNASFDLLGPLRNSAFAVFMSLLLAAVVIITPVQRIAAQTQPTRDDAGKLDEFGFLAGNWKVKYTDRLLGEVTGYAVVERGQPAGPPLVRYTVEDPRTKQRYEMIALDVRRNRNVLEMSFYGASPSAGAGSGVSGASVPSNEAPIEAAVGTKITASLDGVTKDATVVVPAASAAVPPVQSSLLLRFPFGGAASGRNRLDGQWLVRRHWQQGFDGLRTGEVGKETAWKSTFEDAADVMRGGETWERSGPQIELVTIAEMDNFGRFAGVDPSYFKDRENLTPAWLRITGTELPIKPNEKVEVSFEDPNVKYTGGHRPDPKVPGALQIEVDLNKKIQPGPKELTLNGSVATWEFDFPGLEPKEIRYVRLITEGPEYEATNVLYMGEVYYIEVEFPHAPFYNERKFMTQSDVALAFSVVKVPGQPKVFRSRPMLLLERNSPQPTDKELPVPKDPNTSNEHIVVPAWEGATLMTTAADVIQPDANPPVGVARVVDAPDGRYQQALDMAKAIRKQYPDRANYTLSVRIITEWLKQRRTLITVEDHAALILLHEELQKHVENFHKALKRALPPSLPQGDPSIARYWQKEKKQLVQQLIATVRRTEQHDAPLLQFKVAAPGSLPASRDRETLVSSNNSNNEVTLAAALGQATQESMPGTREQKEQKFQEYATWAVMNTERQVFQKTGQALHEMSNADIRKPNELLTFARIGYDSLAPLLMQELVRPSNPSAREPLYPRWVPDRAGRAAVLGIADLVAAVKSEESYSRFEKFLIILGLTVATLGFAGAVALATRYGFQVALLAFAGKVGAAALTVGDIGFFISDVQQARKTSNEADVALGTSPVTGVRAYHELRAEADAAMFSAALTGVALLATPLFMAAASRGLRPSRAAMENAIFFAERRGLKGRGVEGLSQNNRTVFEYTRGMAEYRATHFGADALTDLEKRALRAAYPDGLPEGLAQNWKVRSGDTTLPPVRASDPSVPRVDPRAETASVPRLPKDSESKALGGSSGPGSSASRSDEYFIDLREAAPERSSNPTLRRLYGEGETAARSGNQEALARQSRLESAELEWQRLSPAERGRVDAAWKTLQKLRQANPNVARIDEADALSLLMMQAKRERPRAPLPTDANRPLAPNPVDPEEMAAIVTEWHRVPVTPDELARASNVSPANAKASLDGARSVVDRFRGGGHGASGGGARSGPGGSGAGGGGGSGGAIGPSGPSSGTFIDIEARSRAIERRLVDMGVPAADAERAAIVPAAKKLDLDAATAGAAWMREVPAGEVMRRLGVTREQLRDLLDKYHRSVFSDSPANRAAVIDNYINADAARTPAGTRPATASSVPPRPAPEPRPPAAPSVRPRTVLDTPTEVLPRVDFPPLRVSEPVPGLYDSVSTSGVPAPGWRFSDQPIEIIDGGVRRIQTRVTTPDGLEGRVSRGYDPQKKQIVMYSAFLDELRDSPHRWIKAGKPLVAEQGTPTVAYATMRQMKLLGVPYGGARSVKIHRVENVEAVMQLKALMKQNIPLNRAVLQTHSVQYAETALVQSGHEIVSNSTRVILARNPTGKLKELLEWDLVNATDEVRAAIQRRHEGLLRQYGLTPDDEVVLYYDIHMDVRPVAVVR